MKENKPQKKQRKTIEISKKNVIVFVHERVAEEKIQKVKVKHILDAIIKVREVCHTIIVEVLLQKKVRQKGGVATYFVVTIDFSGIIEVVTLTTN